MLQWSLNTEATFISTGFSNWKDACNKFNVHQKNKAHEENNLRHKAIYHLAIKRQFSLHTPS